MGFSQNDSSDDKKLAFHTIRQIIIDLIGAVGLGLIGYGLYQYLPWLAYTVVGTLLIAFACLASSRNVI